MTDKPHRGKIIVFGILFWYPLAGVTYQFLHYLLGLRRLGYDPFYVEDSGRYVYDPRLNDVSADADYNVSVVAPILEAHGFAGRWAFRGAYPGGRCYGLSEQALKNLYGDADAFLNVTGAQEIRDEQAQIKRRIYVESDPFAAQVKVSSGNTAVSLALAAHDTLFSFGENIGAPDCAVPATNFEWLPTRQPVALELWQGGASYSGAAYNTITTWHNKGKNIQYLGETWYWTKDREFEKFLGLPKLSGRSFELATKLDAASERILAEQGWRLTDAPEVSRQVTLYRNYIQQSRGEFTVARDQYVRPHTGWFSDRSACYLAAARPVITQETGFSKFLPTGKGLFAFKTMEDILTAIDAIESDYAGNCRAARAIAAEYFAAEKVLGILMKRARL